jgi:sensor histidine kinase regulating citrate/malate metabolism
VSSDLGPRSDSSGTRRTGTVTPAGSRLEILEAMIDGAREGLCILNGTSTLLHGNKVAGELLGFDPGKAAGLLAHELGVDRDFDWSIAGEVAAGRVAVSTVQTLRTDRKLLVSGVPIASSDGQLAYIVITIREITGMGQVMSRLRDAV